MTIDENNATSIKLLWSPPPLWAVPGIIRYYNLSYRVLNISDSEITSLAHVETSYTIAGLTPYTLYEINISAFTVSTGPQYTLFVMTDEAGLYDNLAQWFSTTGNQLLQYVVV